MIRLLLIVTFISTVCTKVVAQESLKSPKDLILLIGQSNMAGRATLLPEDDKVIDGAFLYDSLNHWIPLKNPLNIHSSIRKIARMQKLNLGFTFAKKITETKTLNPIGLVVNARGGTKIQAWLPGTFYYKEAVRRSLEAIKEGAKFRAVLWHQGEGNLNYDSDIDYDGYFEKLKLIIYQLRKDLKNDELIFIAGELNKDNPKNIRFKSMLARLETEVPFAGSVKSEGTKTKDGTHFDNEGLKIMGDRYAEKLISLMK